MEGLAGYVGTGRYVLLGVVALSAVIGALRISREKAARRDLLRGIIGTVAVVAMGIVASATSWFYVAIFFAGGVVFGLVLGRIRPLAAWLTALSIVYFAMALLWDTGGYFAAGLGVLAFGVAIQLGQGIRGRMAGATVDSSTPVVEQ